MRAGIASHRSDAILRRDLFAAAARERENTAEFIALIAEYDARRLFVVDGYSSMHAFCVGEFNLCENSAYKRIQAARAGWKFPGLFDAMADGRLHMTAVFLLAPHLTPENVDELVTACTRKRRREVEDLLANRFLRTMPSLPLDAASPSPEVGEPPAPAPGTPTQLVPVPVNLHPSKMPQAVKGQPVDPPRRIDVHCAVDRDKLEHARALLSHCVPSGDLGSILDRALDAVIREMERRKFGATSRPRNSITRRASANARQIPAHVKREVWTRDGGRCTYVGPNGHRCAERRFLEFDHIRPVALGGEATVDDLRLRCRVHNQYEAERVFGTEFMAEKRAAAQRERAEAKAAKAAAPPKPNVQEQDRVRAIASGLRNLGCRAGEAREAAQSAVEAAGPAATLEECLRAALRSLGSPRGTRREAVAT